MITILLAARQYRCASSHLCALQVSADSQWARIEFLQFRNSCIKINWANVTDNQSSNACLFGDMPNDIRCRVYGMLHTSING